MPHTPRSLEAAGWRVWLDENPAPCGWKADEFDILMRHGATTALIKRIWNIEWRTAKKRITNWRLHAESESH